MDLIAIFEFFICKQKCVCIPTISTKNAANAYMSTCENSQIYYQ